MTRDESKAEAEKIRFEFYKEIRDHSLSGRLIDAYNLANKFAIIKVEGNYIQVYTTSYLISGCM